MLSLFIIFISVFIRKIRLWLSFLVLSCPGFCTRAFVRALCKGRNSRSIVRCCSHCSFTGFAATVPAVLQDTGIGQLLGSWGAHLSSRASSSAGEAAGPCGEGVGSGAAHTCACAACHAAAAVYFFCVTGRPPALGCGDSDMRGCEDMCTQHCRAGASPAGGNNSSF